MKRVLLLLVLLCGMFLLPAESSARWRGRAYYGVRPYYRPSYSYYRPNYYRPYYYRPYYGGYYGGYRSYYGPYAYPRGGLYIYPGAGVGIYW